jgi:hypothetical protein
MTRKFNLLALLGAAAVTVLVVAGLSDAASKAAPVNTAAPKISGTAQQGQTLTVTTGTWTSSSTLSYTYQWRRCDNKGNGCANIGGADTSSYLLKNADVGNTVRARVTAKNTDGSTAATADQSDVITSATPAPSPTGCPTSGTGPVDIAQVTSPAHLAIDGQQVTPTPVARSTADLTVRFHVSACNGRSVTGALIYVTAVPYSQWSIPPEIATGSDGWATLTMHQDRFWPASPRQQLLVMFVRARKTGEPTLAGISARRLVSFPVHL